MLLKTYIINIIKTKVKPNSLYFVFIDIIMLCRSKFKSRIARSKKGYIISPRLRIAPIRDVMNSNIKDDI